MAVNQQQSPPMKLVQDIGEPGLLKVVQRYCPGQVVGDDAALVTITPGQKLVVTTDVLVDGVHFSLGQVNPEVITMSAVDVGWRAAAANLSDLAAMGATPLGITVGLGLPGQTPVACVEDIYQGLVECLQAFGSGVILGGDICRSGVLSLGITALGEVIPEQAIYRHTAQPGDLILVTGAHGASRAGLELLLKPTWGEFLTLEERQALIHTHQRPIPRFDVVQRIRQHLPQARITGMDSSDGLGDAILQMCRQSQTGAKLWADQIPLVATLPADLRWNWGLYGGEDFELVLSLAPEAAKALLPLLPTGAEIIGEMTRGLEIEIVRGAQRFKLEPDQRFAHF